MDSRGSDYWSTDEFDLKSNYKCGLEEVARGLTSRLCALSVIVPMIYQSTACRRIYSRPPSSLAIFASTLFLLLLSASAVESPNT